MPRPKKQKWREYPVDKDQIGELTFFEDGAVQIANRVYLPTALIDDVQFANGHVARRRIDQPRILEVVAPDGEHHYFRYGPILRTWYRRIPEIRRSHSPFKQNLNNLGPLVGTIAWAGTQSSRVIVPWLLRALLYSIPVLIFLGAFLLIAALFK